MKEKPRYLPLFFNLTGRTCLVVGGGAVALRKVQQLLEAQAQVTIVAPELMSELEVLVRSESCHWQGRKYQPGEATGYRLVIAAADDPVVNRQVYDDCERSGIPVNVVDQPALCSVIFPSILRRGMTTIAISSEGNAPFFTRYLRGRMQSFLEELPWLDKPELLIAFRQWVRARVHDETVKAKLYDRFLSCASSEWSAWEADHPPLEVWESWLSETGE